MHAKANDAPRELAHDHEHPVGLEQNGLAPKQINAPETVFDMSDEGKPRKSIVIEMWVVGKAAGKNKTVRVVIFR